MPPRGAACAGAENAGKRKRPDAEAATAGSAAAQYATYKEYYEKKYGFKGLSTTMPLMQVKGFSLHSSAVNYLMPPSQATRHREMRRMAQHRAIAKTLYHANQQESAKKAASGAGCVGALETAAKKDVGAGGGGGEGKTGTADAPDGDLAVLSWRGPKLVPELCSVHPLQLSAWRALQFIPSLMYRLEVRSPTRAHTPPAGALCVHVQEAACAVSQVVAHHIPTQSGPRPWAAASTCWQAEPGLWAPCRTLPAMRWHLPSVARWQDGMQGLLVAHELRERLRPRWLLRSEAPSTNKVLEAITHRSCADAIDFERYELLGDAFLKFATARHLYSTRKDSLDEGGMSLELHRRVSNGTLWRCSVVRSACLACMCTAAANITLPRS